MSNTPTSPIAQLEKWTNWSLALSILSLFCFGLLAAIPAYVLASKAQGQAAQLGVTSVDQKIKTARILAIVGIALQVVILIIVVATS